MIENPQELIKIIKIENYSNSLVDSNLDAIFIPFTNRIDNLKDLLKELSFFKENIYILPSNNKDLELLKGLLDDNVKLLTIMDTDFINCFNNLETTNHEFVSYQSKWDIPLKRNYAIYYSRIKEYNNILLLDDDICNLTPSILKSGIVMLQNNSISGCIVNEEIDTSILGHLQKKSGEIFYPFISGSFLFINPNSIKSFFPNIYNEDWLFMIPYILDNSICSFGNISQKENKGIDDISIVKLQEFGDIVAEGLYTLIHLKEYNNRYLESYWKEVINERKLVYYNLINENGNSIYGDLINTALKIIDNIQPSSCVKFINQLDNDLIKWNNYIN